jgi:hypothetical protein
MKIDAEWSKPRKLESGKKFNLIYYVDIEELPEEPGCYVFYNKYGDSISIHYIGKADNIRKRIGQQLNNLKLMLGIKNSMKGNKFLIYFLTNGGIKSKKKSVKILEKQLIKYATLEGHELINIKGTKLHFDKVSFKGNRDSEVLFGRNMNIIK